MGVKPKVTTNLIRLDELALKVNRSTDTLRALRQKGVFEAVHVQLDPHKLGRPATYVDPAYVDKLMAFLLAKGRKPVEPVELNHHCTECGRPLEFEGLCMKCYKERQLAKMAGATS
jgi:hypothetical protein